MLCHQVGILSLTENYRKYCKLASVPEHIAPPRMYIRNKFNNAIGSELTSRVIHNMG